jgi:putative ABC transport system permease protein
MSALWRDFRYGFRMLVRNKSFTAVAVLALALGIGPNVAMFSIIYATFLAPLPYPAADQLVVAWPMVKGQRSAMRADDYVQYQAQSKSFQCLSFSSWSVLYLTNPDHSDDETNGGLPNTPIDCLRMGQEPMLLGRDFHSDEGTPGKDHVVVLTNALWREHFHRDPSILGKAISIADQPYTVVGVYRAGSADRTGVKFYVPLALTAGIHAPDWGSVIGRLKPDATVAQAQAELSLINSRLQATRSAEAGKDAWLIGVEPLRGAWLSKKLVRNLWLLLAAVGFVLLIACANLANLLLARGSSRQQELAVRSAMGATRRQVFSQLLTESLTLAISGGVCGIFLGWALMKTIMSIQTELGKESAEAVVQMNVPVFLFALGAALLAGILSGCAPALQATKLNLSETLKQGSRSVTARGRMKTQRMLVMGEFALAIILLSGAGMALHSFYNLTRIDLGFRTGNILMGSLRPPKNMRTSSEQINATARELLTKLNALPGVQSAALTTSMPLQGHNHGMPFNISGHLVADTDRPVADFEMVTPSYFGTVGAHLVQGRFLSDSDQLGGAQVLIVNHSFVDRFLHGQNALNQHVLLPDYNHGQFTPPTEWQIVGVFQDIPNGEHVTEKTEPQMIASFWQHPARHAQLAVRSVIDPGLISSPVVEAVKQSLPGYALTEVTTMQQTMDEQFAGDRFGMVLFGGFATLALVLAALGIYGVMAFAVAQRSHEIGLRMALGAQRGDVVLLILKDGLKLALLGLGIGLVGVAALGHFMRSTLYGVATVDIASLIGVAVTLVAVAILASYLPAQRSAMIDPMVALRQE